MIAAAEKKNFFASRYELIVLAVGALALAGGIAFMMCGFNEEGVAGQTPRIPANAETGVKPVDMELLSYMLRITKEPFKLPVISDKTGSFLASDRRVYCAECAAPIPSDVKICVECGKSQPEEAQVVYDTDNDGLPDEWEKRFGLNINDPADADLDSDGDLFSNREEFAAGTNPTDPKSHTPYTNYLSLQLPLKETKLPFYFDSVSKLPSGYRFQFIDPTKVNPETRRKGVIYRPLLDEDIGDTGFVAKSYEAKSEKRKIAGGKGMTKTIDVSVAKVVRKADGKWYTLRDDIKSISWDTPNYAPGTEATIAYTLSDHAFRLEGKEIELTVGDRKLQSVDTLATIVFDRGERQEFNVVAGDFIDLKGENYRVQSIRKEGNRVLVLLEHSTLGVKKLLEALEQ